MFGLGLFLLAAACLAALHPANIAAARMKVAADGSIDLKLRFDVLAYLLEEQPDQATAAEMAELADGPPERLAARLADGERRMAAELKVMADGANLPLEAVKFPTVAEVLRAASENGPTRFPVMMTVPLRARLAEGRDRLSVRFPEVLGTVVLTTELPYREPVSEPVEAGSASSEIQVPAPQEITKAAQEIQEIRLKQESPVVASPTKASAPVAKATHPSAAPKPINKPKLPEPAPLAASLPKEPRHLVLASLPPAPFVADATRGAARPESIEQVASSRASWPVLFGRYVKMGFHHILPLGLDHVLFVLGLFLLSSRTKDLLKQVSAFTVAHSLTLGLSLYGVVQLPSSVVEPLIAASIAFVAIENICTSKMHSWRVGVVFGFGLVHGLGFAGALRETGLAHGDFLTGLLGFNAGVELGQLAVVALALAAVGWLRHSPRYRAWVTVPASLAIAGIALFWTLQRIAG